MLGNIVVIGEVPDRIIQIDYTVEVGAEFVGRSAHVANHHAHATLWQHLRRLFDGTWLDV